MILHGKRILLDISELKDGIIENLNKKYKDGIKLFYTILVVGKKGNRLATNALKDNYSKEDTSIWVQERSGILSN